MADVDGDFKAELVFSNNSDVAFDLRVDQVQCPELDISVDVANIGFLGLGPGVAVSFYEQDAGLLGTVTNAGPLPAGASETVNLQSRQSIPSATSYAVVDDAGMGMGVLNECDESNETEPQLVKRRRPRAANTFSGRNRKTPGGAGWGGECAIGLRHAREPCGCGRIPVGSARGLSPD